MIIYTDKDYKETKLIKQGSSQIHSGFKVLAEWINETYNSKVINIYYDTVKSKINRPRLSIILEYQNDELKFRHGFLGNFDTKKQRIIADKFDKLVNDQSSLLNKLFRSKKYDTKDLLVVFTSFEPIAKDEANSIIPEDEINKLKEELSNKDLWTIYRQFSGTTFFFYTDKQVEQYTTDGTISVLTEKYYNLLKRYDAFNYFEKDSFTIKLDSKENFDNNYKGSWFYYSR